MNKTYDELLQEVQMLRGKLEDKRHEFNGLVSMITDIERALEIETDGENGHEPILIAINQMRGQLEESKRHGDELAAHAERMRIMAESVFSDLEGDPQPTCHEIFQVAVQAPANSLAAHDAKLLIGLAEELDGHSLLDRGCLLIKAAAPEGATHYCFEGQCYIKKIEDKWCFLDCGCWVSSDAENCDISRSVSHGDMIVLANIPTDDMAESMPFELLEGDEEEQRSKYHREIKPGVWVDCYDVLKAFDVRCPALQHMIKKCLAPGQRGHKDLHQDMQDIVVSAKRAQELAQ